MRTRLTEDQLHTELATLPQWQGDPEGIRRTFSFATYADGVAFALKVALLAEKIDHHPDRLTIGWKKVEVVYVTHDAGGVTLRDLEAARKVEGL